MLIVLTEVRPSKWGNGLFATQFIAKGTIVWVLHKGWDLEKTRDEIVILNSASRAIMETYTFKSRRTGKYIYCVDNARFFNHSPQSPNVISIYSLSPEQKSQLTPEEWATVDMDEGFCVAARDIQVGEELFTDYNEDGAIDEFAGSAFLLKDSQH